MTRILPITLLAGCIGDITNSIFDEDKIFLGALPSAERTRIDLDEPGTETGRSTDSGDACSMTAEMRALYADWPVLLQYTWSTAFGVNCGVAGQLAIIDYIRTLPPTSRTTDSRTWGPYEVEDDVWIVAYIERSGSTFTWSIDAANESDGPWVEWFAGEHLSGETVATGLGEFSLDYGAAGSITGDDWEGSATSTYDLRDDRQLYVTFDEMRIEDMEEALTADYWFAEADEGNDFEFRTASDFIEEDGAEETMEIRSRWIPREGGRSDAWLSEGTLGGEVVRVTQCWDARGDLVFQEDDAGYIPVEGSVSDCVFSDVAELEHI